MQWTMTLRELARNVALDYSELKYRESLMEDIRSRASEYVSASLGPMKPYQVEYTVCLLQRLQTELPSHKALADALNEAMREQG